MATRNIINFSEYFETYKLPLLEMGVRLPVVDPTPEEKQKVGAPSDCSNYEYLTYLVFNGYEKRLKQGKIPAAEVEIYTEKAKKELEIFKKNNLVDYFLLLYDVLKWCDDNDIARGVGRGSSGGSLVLYLLGCTEINPLIHNLYFERFISEARLQSKVIDGNIYLNGKTMPDCDCDFSYYNRHKVIEYLESKYSGKISKICTLTTLTGKLLIKECSKVVLGYNEDQSKVISDMISKHFGIVTSLEKCYEENEDFKVWADENEKCYKIALSLENTIKNKGQHASGIAISYYSVNDTIPLELSSSKEIVSSYDMDSIAQLLIKIDILGLRNCDINYETCKMASIEQGTIDINDPCIYNYLQHSNNFFGLFQIETGLTKQTVLKVRPKNIDQLACCVSISRPGVYTYLDQYIDYIHNGILKSFHPLIDEVIKSTGNVIVYQESINNILQKVYEMSAVDADQVRKCIGKKLREEIKKWKPIVFEQGKKKNIPEDVTEKLWKTIQACAFYQYNLSHGYLYAYMTAINTYLKVNYPREFYLSLLKMSKNEPNTNQVVNQIVEELKETNIKILPPHIIDSDIDFKLEGENGIRVGLGNLKGVAEKTIDKLKSFRNKYQNKFEIMKAAEECGLPINIICAMIQAGCMDDYLTSSRSKIVAEAQLYNILTDREKNKVMEVGETYKYNLFAIMKEFSKMTDEKGKLIIKESRLNTIREKFKTYNSIFNKNSKNEKLASYFYEMELLGFSYSQKIESILKDYYPDIRPISDIINEVDRTQCELGGEIKEVRYWTANNDRKTKCLKVKVADSTGSIYCLLFEEGIINSEKENSGKFEEGQIVMVRGKKKGDSITCELIRNQKACIYIRTSDIKKKKEKNTEKIS